MKTNQIFVISALIVSAAFFGILSLFDLPHSTMEWLISDIVLGLILYLSYLAIAMSRSTSRTALHDELKTSQFFLIAALVISGIFFGVLFFFDLPHSTMEWIISDAILGLILYVGYLAIAMKRNRSSKKTLPNLSKKVTEQHSAS